MQKSTKKGMRLIAVALALVMAIGGSLAYFTDSASTNQSGTAGTVDVELDGSGINLLDEDGKQILNPGDLRDVYFTVSNKGNKSVDIRTTITLTSSIGMAQNGQAEFEIYKLGDVEFVDGEGWKPVAGAEPLQIRSISDDGYTITYAIPEYILNGNEELPDMQREIEPDVAVDADPYFDVSDGGSIADSKYVLVFKTASDNNYQEANVTLNVKVEAKQHRNTEAGWELVGDSSNEQPGEGTDQYVATYVLRGNDIPDGAEVIANGATDTDSANNTFGFQANRPIMMMMRAPYSGSGDPDAVVIEDMSVTTESGESVPVNDDMSFTAPAENITVEISAYKFPYDVSEQITLRPGQSFVAVNKKYVDNNIQFTATLYEKNDNGSWTATQVTPLKTATDENPAWSETLIATNGDKMEVSDSLYTDEVEYIITLVQDPTAETYNLTYNVHGNYSDEMNFVAYLTTQTNGSHFTTYPANEIRIMNVEDTITNTYRAPYLVKNVTYRTASGAPISLNADNSFTTPAEDIIVDIYVEEQYMYALSENYLFVTDAKGSTWVYDGTMGRGWNGSAEGLITLTELNAMNLTPVVPSNIVYNVSAPFNADYPRVEVIIGNTNYRLDCQRQYADYRIVSVNPLTEEVPEGPTADELLYQSLGGYSISYSNKFADGAGVTNKSDYYELIAGPTAAETYIFTKYVYSDEWADWVDNTSGSQLNHIRVTPDSLTHYKAVDEFGNAEGYYIVFEIDGYTYVATAAYSDFSYIRNIKSYAPGAWSVPANWTVFGSNPDSGDQGSTESLYDVVSNDSSYANRKSGNYLFYTNGTGENTYVFDNSTHEQIAATVTSEETTDSYGNNVTVFTVAMDSATYQVTYNPSTGKITRVASVK